MKMKMMNQMKKTLMKSDDKSDESVVFPGHNAPGKNAKKEIGPVSHCLTMKPSNKAKPGPSHCVRTVMLFVLAGPCRRVFAAHFTHDSGRMRPVDAVMHRRSCTGTPQPPQPPFPKSGEWGDSGHLFSSFSSASFSFQGGH